MGIRDDRYTAIKAVEGEVPVLIKALQDQDSQVHANAVLALGEIGTLEALKVVKEYESQQ